MNKDALVVKDLTVSLDNFTLDDISFSVPRGTILGIVGRNGAGKTTLIRTIAGIYDKKAGDIFINGYTVSEEKEYLKQLGIMTETGIFNMFHKVKRIKKMLKKTYDHFDETFFDTYANTLEIDQEKRMLKLSTGDQKKVNLISVMSLNPQVLILDEPTANIDPISKRNIIEMLQTYLENEQKTIVFATHQTELLDKIADYLLIIEKGKVLLSGIKDDILASHFLINVTQDIFKMHFENHCICYKKTITGYDILTQDKPLLDMLKLTYQMPSIEELLFYYVEGAKQ